jgi:hypothetical protein
VSDSKPHLLFRCDLESCGNEERAARSFREKGRGIDLDWHSYIFNWRDLAITLGFVELVLKSKE